MKIHEYQAKDIFRRHAIHVPEGRAVFSIGEAEDYRTYWQPGWTSSPPDWLTAENPDWSGNYLVRYWDPSWQGIVFAELAAIVAAGFDGVYLDKIDAYESFETDL